MPLIRLPNGKLAMGPGASRNNYTGPEDSTVIKAAFNEAYQRYSDSVGSVSVSELLMSYGGDKQAKSRLADDLAAAKGTTHKSQMESIRRWLKAEQGQTGSQTRKPDKKSASVIKDLFVRQFPPSDMSITIRGEIGYDNDFRHRTISTGSGTLYPVDTRAFIDAMQRGTTHEAYNIVFASYAGLTVKEAYNIDLHFS